MYSFIKVGWTAERRRAAEQLEEAEATIGQLNYKIKSLGINDTIGLFKIIKNYHNVYLRFKQSFIYLVRKSRLTQQKPFLKFY